MPPPPLSPLIRRYIGYRYSGLQPGTHLGLPSPDLTVVLSLGPKTRLASMPDPRQRPAAFDALVGGLHTRPAVLAYDTEMFGIELDMTPAGARSWAVIVVTGTPRWATRRGRATCSHRDTLRGSVETMISS